MPAAGVHKEHELFYTGEYGRIWSSSLTQYSGSAYDIYFGSLGSSLDINIKSLIDELWYWYGTEEESFNDLPESLVNRLRKYFDAGNVDMNNIPESIYNEYRTYLVTIDRSVYSYDDRYWGLPVRAVCP